MIFSSPRTTGAGVGEIEREERIGLPEGHHVAPVPEEAHGVDAFALSEPPDPTGLGEHARPSREHGDLALPRPESSVVATRNTPSCSDSENELSNSPGTSPLAR